MGVYAVLGGLLVLALQQQTRFPFLERKARLASAVLGSFYGMTDELHQLFVPGRTCDVWDWTADTLGVVLGIVIVPRLWRWYLRRAASSAPDEHP
jgi:VanZ family protein